MKYRAIFISALFLVAAIISCGDKITRPEENRFTSATVYLDDVSVWGFDPAELQFSQLVENGDMESWTENDSSGPPDHWLLASTALTAKREQTRVHDGECSAKLTWTSTDDQTFISEPIPVAPDSVYACSLYVYDDDKSGLAQAIVLWNNGDTYTGENSSNSPEWQLLAFSATAPADADSMRIGLRFQDVLEGLSDTVYVQLNPPWDADHGYDFQNPGKVIVGRDTYIYICDTGNDRIVRMDAAGTVYQTYDVPHPTGVTQDELLRLLVVNRTRDIYKINVGPDGNGESVICYSGSRAIDDSLIFRSQQNFVFTDISDVPGNGKVYLACGYDTLLDATGQVYAFWNSVTIAENTDTLQDGADRQSADSTLDPAVDYGTGVSYTDHPNGIASFIRGSTLYLLVTQDSSSFKTQLLEWYVNPYYNVAYFQAAISPGGDNDIYSDRYRGLLPNASATDSSGNIYIVTSPDTSGGLEAPSAFKFDPTGKLKEEWGPFGFGNGEMNFPRGIAYDDFADRRTVYVSDSGNNRILRFKLSTDIEQ